MCGSTAVSTECLECRHVHSFVEGNHDSRYLARFALQAIYTFSLKLQISIVSQYLHPLPNFSSDVMIMRVCCRQFRFKGVYFLKAEFALSDPFDAPHDMEQPAFRAQVVLPPEKKSLLPSGKHIGLRLDNAVLYQGYPAEMRYCMEQDPAADPTSPSGGGRERLSFFDDLGCEEMLGDDDQTGHSQRSVVVVEQEEVWIGIPGEPPHHCRISAIDHFGSKTGSLAFQLIFFLAGGTVEVANFLVVAESRDVAVPAVRAVYLAGYPRFGCHPGALQSAGVGVRKMSL